MLFELNKCQSGNLNNGGSVIKSASVNVKSFFLTIRPWCWLFDWVNDWLITDPNRHPSCTDACPGHAYLTSGPMEGAQDLRVPTWEDYDDDIVMELNESGDLIDSRSGVSFQKLKLLYVTDQLQPNNEAVCFIHSVLFTDICILYTSSNIL